MNTMWGSLLWKEWREHRGLIAILAVAYSALFPWMFTERVPTWVQDLGWAPIIIIPLTSLFVGASIAASEQSRRTIYFLQALPIRMALPAGAKLVLALVTVLTPCIAFLLVNLYFADDVPGDPIRAIAQFALCSASLLIWVSAIGVNRSDEVRAGAVGLITILAIWAVLAIALRREAFGTGRLDEVATVMAPGGAAKILDRNVTYPLDWQLVAVAAAVHAALIASFLLRFGRIDRPSDSKLQNVERKAGFDWLPPPRRRPITALLWKQLRETLPLALLGAAAVFCISIVLGVAWNRSGEVFDSIDFVRMAGAVWIMTGFFVSIVAGIGLFIDDLRPELHTFWRSRPIAVGQWFFIKFFPGLLLTVVTLTVPLALVIGGGLVAGAWNAELVRQQWRECGQIFWLALLGQTATLCVAGAMMAVVRRPVMAATLTIVLVVCVLAIFNSQATQPPPEVLIVGAAGLAVVVAWLAVRNDWSWKG